jgi:K(+)-stimulated pyrophosphate-energized sodium pump
MHTWLESGLMGRVIRSSATSSSTKFLRRAAALALVMALLAFVVPLAAHAQTPTQPPATAPSAPVVHEQGPARPASEAGGEANLHVPSMKDAKFINGSITGYSLLEIGLVFCALGGLFGLIIYMQLKGAPVHRAMKEISELIYETCKTYLVTQGKFILLLWAFIAVVIAMYFGWLAPIAGAPVGVTLPIILLFSLIGIAGSYGVAWFGIRVNTFANSRTAFAGLRGKPYPIYAIPLKAGMSIGMMLISVELLIMLCILLLIPADYSGACFIGFAIGESLGAAALRIAGGIFTKIADIGSDLMKIVFKIKEDDARNPGVIADCTGDNAGDSVGPSADGFETYGVTGVALITFILLGVRGQQIQVELLVWIFVMRIMMLVASSVSYFINEGIARAKYANSDEMNFEAPLTSLVWITSVVSMILTFVVSWLIIPNLGGRDDLWWKLSIIISCGTLAGAIIPELVKVFTSVESRHVGEVVTSSEEGGSSLNILSGLVAGNFSAYWLGISIVGLMSVAYYVSTLGLGGAIGTPDQWMLAPAVFAFGLVAFGFLGMGPVTIAVDSYGPVTDNAQSVYELSLIEQVPNVIGEVKREHGFDVNFERAKHLLEANDGAGNTFKATAKPVLIGTAVVGATTMIFSIMMALTDGLTRNTEFLSLLHAPFVLGLITGGAIIYWFTGASTQAVTTGAYRAVEFIKRNIRLEGVEKASVEDSKKVVEICTKYAQKGMFNIFLTVFFATLAFAFVEPFFFIGYLISIAVFGLYQAIFMANAGGAWDNAKKVVEVELKQKGTALHDATVVGDTVGDPFKDTSSVALNPIIKFTTLFGLLAVELAVRMTKDQGSSISHIFAAIFFAISIFFVWRSFYGMRIGSQKEAQEAKVAA